MIPDRKRIKKLVQEEFCNDKLNRIGQVLRSPAENCSVPHEYVKYAFETPDNCGLAPDGHGRIKSVSLPHEYAKYLFPTEDGWRPCTEKKVTVGMRRNWRTPKEKCRDMLITHKNTVLRAETLYGSLLVSPQQLRSFIASLRYDGCPIVSNGNGYKWTTDKNELNDYVNKRLSNISKEHNVICNMIKDRKNII